MDPTIFHGLEDGDRLMNLILGRLSKDWMVSTGSLDKKNGSSLDIGPSDVCLPGFGFSEIHS